MKFEDLKLSDKMLKTLGEMKFITPSEIQYKAIPIILAGKDIVGQAQTGTGKTASFAIPFIEKTVEEEGIQNLVLAPSRELAKQIHEEVYKLTKGTKLKTVTLIGGVSYDKQRKDMSKKPEIVIATPGRLIDHLESKKIPIDLDNVKTFTLDEADEMLNYGFYKDMLKIAKYLPAKKQTLLFTATFNKKTKELAKNLLNNPVSIEVSKGLSTSAIIKQKYLVVQEKNKLVTLYNLLQMHEHDSVIIFGRTRKRVDELTRALIKLGFEAQGIQGDMQQNERSRAMKQFREGQTKILIGTDVLARGIDVDSVDLVFNFDLPTEIEYYTHRIGRTGRAGKKGAAISFVKSNEMGYFNQIIKKTESDIKEINAPTDEDMVDVKAQQLDAQLSKLLHVGREKYRKIGEKIGTEYTIEHLGLITAAAVIGSGLNPYSIKLSGESSSETTRGNKGGRRQGGRSGGGRSSQRSSGNNRGRSSQRSSDKGGRSSQRSSGKSRTSSSSKRQYSSKGKK